VVFAETSRSFSLAAILVEHLLLLGCTRSGVIVAEDIVE